jgi:hypothetical protein
MNLLRRSRRPVPFGDRPVLFTVDTEHGAELHRIAIRPGTACATCGTLGLIEIIDDENTRLGFQRITIDLDVCPDCSGTGYEPEQVAIALPLHTPLKSGWRWATPSDMADLT